MDGKRVLMGRGGCDKETRKRDTVILRVAETWELVHHKQIKKKSKWLDWNNILNIAVCYQKEFWHGLTFNLHVEKNLIICSSVLTHPQPHLSLRESVVPMLSLFELSHEPAATECSITACANCSWGILVPVNVDMESCLFKWFVLALSFHQPAGLISQ